MLTFIALFQSAIAQISFQTGSSFAYMKGGEAVSLSSSWMLLSYDYSNWEIAHSPFRYGDGEGGTVFDDMRYNYSTFYLRSSFIAQNIDLLENVSFGVNFDDGFIVWINGKRILEVNAPSNPSNNSFSTDLHESGSFEYYTIDINSLNIVNGENQIAVQVFNTSLTSSDIYFDLEITASIPTPPVPTTNDSLKVIFSNEAGFYDEPFTLKLEVPDNTYELVYTIDGSNPQFSNTAINGGKSAALVVNPNNTNGRPGTPCFLVRASLIMGDMAPSLPKTQTYIFIENVLVQKYPGGSWPTSSVNGQALDFEMDSKVTQSSLYKNDMEASLLSIPSISIVTDNESLFDLRTGIYVNALMHGIDWERFCSVELINSNEEDGFNVNAGLRIRGGWSRNDNFAKHAFRLFFREEYGFSKLKYRLFKDEGTDEFDKIDLRTAQNYAWSNNNVHNTFVREVFSRDTQREMGQPFTRSRYYHLYLNGMYWGLYQTQERAEASYAESYLGGKQEDYDVIKVNGDYSYTIEATDGNTDKWEEIWNMCVKGFSSNSSYFQLEGKDSKGIPVKGVEEKVDIDNLIDYMITIFYTGNFDAPVSKFKGDQSPNNFYAIGNRNDKSQGFKFFAHDCEHSLFAVATSPGIGLRENRVQLSNMNVTNFSKFHPQWLHQCLTKNAEYRLRFADRVRKHFFDNGVFSIENCEKRFLSRAKEIEMAIIAESARWGNGTGNGASRTKYNDWKPEIESVVNNYFPFRGDIVLAQLVNANLYPATEPPIFKTNNKSIDDCEYRFDMEANLTFESQQISSEIYFTTDGSDPRLTGGEVNPISRKAEKGQTINVKGTTWIKARIKRGNEWSAVRELRMILNDEVYSDLKITELHYHPADTITNTDTINNKSFEFIEIKNVGSNAIDLSSLIFTDGIEFAFVKEAILPSSKFFVIASSSKWFYERYGVKPSDVYNGALNNSGETVTLMDNIGREVFNFTYSDTNPWTTEVDGTGYSLVSADINPTGSPELPEYWRASYHYNGSPFYDDTISPLLSEDIKDSGLAIKVYPNPASDYVFIDFPKNEECYTEIYSLTGKRLFSETFISNARIDLKSISGNYGILIVKIHTNSITHIQKISYTP